MATEQDISEFAYGEEIVIELSARDRDGNVYPAATAECTMIVAAAPGAAALLEVDIASGHVVLDDEGTALFIVTLDHVADVAPVLAPEVTYRFWLWTTTASDNELQATGAFRLKRATLPS